METSTVIALGAVAAIAAAAIIATLNKRSRRKKEKEKDMSAGLQVFDESGRLEVDTNTPLGYFQGKYNVTANQTLTVTIPPLMASFKEVIVIPEVGALLDGSRISINISGNRVQVWSPFHTPILIFVV